MQLTKMKGNDCSNNYINRQILYSHFSSGSDSGKRQNSTEKRSFLLGVRLSIQTYSVCMVFSGIGVPPESWKWGTSFFCS